MSTISLPPTPGPADLPDDSETGANGFPAATFRIGRELVRRLRGATSRSILEQLTDRQYIAPHAPLGSVLQELRSVLLLCPLTSLRAMEELHLDPSVAIGRLRRADLTELAARLHRFSRQSSPTRAACATDKQSLQ